MLTNILDYTLGLFNLQRIGTHLDMATKITNPRTSSWWSGSLLPFIPKPLKALFLLIILLNIKSFPLLWHLRLWSIAYAAKIQANWKGPAAYYRQLGVGVGRAFRTTVDGEAVNGHAEQKGETGTCHVAKIPSRTKPYKFLSDYEYPKDATFGHRFEHPMGVRSTRTYRASFDDCDYNLHLSNSSYAKNLDYARMQACIDCFSPFFAPQGWMALGGSHYEFVKEIGMGKEYEIRFGIAGWEEKWIYFVGEFVTYPKGKKAGKSASTTPPTNADAPNGNGAPEGKGQPRSKQLQIREDGSVLHCFSISTYCFKLGRVTIPPAVVLSYCGYGSPSNWTRAQHLLSLPDKGKSWLLSGYKDEAEKVGAEWEEGAKTDVAETCVKGREYGGMLKAGLEGLRSNLDRVGKTS